MYSDVKSVRILVALLKAYNIKDVVLSSGTCSIPVIYSLETDDFFNCYSDVDERSAVYFAIGISQMKQQPVGVVCTSGTAACNYLPGVCEAKKLNVPVVIITCDKDPNTLGHLTIQKINQHDMYADNCKMSVSLPIIKDGLDEWAVKTMISQALLETNHHGKGPVHINIYTDGDKKTFNMPELPNVKKIERLDYLGILRCKKKLAEELTKYKKILVVIGELYPFSRDEIEALENFCTKYNAVVSAELVANVNSGVAINTYKLTEQLSPKLFMETLKPDLVISMGGNFASYEIKTLLKRSPIKHWWVDPDGAVVDIWRSINKVFECTPGDFFSILSESELNSANPDLSYLDTWREKVDAIVIPDSGFTSLYAVGKLCDRLDRCNVLHLGILNSTRIVHLHDISKDIRVYSNLGALGIDGSLSSFLGQSSVQDIGLNICLLGDLSFIYDINSMYGKAMPENVRMMLLNNGGGSEFHLNTGISVIPTLDDYISAGHSSKAREWALACGMKYFEAVDKNTFDQVFLQFLDAEGPAFLEIITDIESDALAIKNMYAANGYSTNQKKIGFRIRKVLQKTLGIQKTQKITKIVKVWKEK